MTRFAQLDALEAMIAETSLEDVLDDLGTLCMVKSKEARERRRPNDVNRWENHGMVMHAARDFVKREDELRDLRADGEQAG